MDDDSLPGVDVLLDLDLPAIPRIRPLGDELVCTLDSGVDLLAGPAEVGHIPDEIGMGAELTGGAVQCSQPRLMISTFSCDIARAVSPVAADGYRIELIEK